MLKTALFRRPILLAAALLAIAAVAGFGAARHEVQAQSSSAYRGVLVLAVEPGSPANTAGLVRGDIILSVNGKDVNTTAEITQAIAAQKPGDSVSLRFLHGDVDRTISVKLGDRDGTAFLGVTLAPQAEGPLATVPYGRQGFPRGFGYGYGQIPPMMRGFALRGSGGAYVATVTADSPAAKAGIVVGDIIEAVDGTGIDASHDLAALIGAKKPGDQATLIVRTTSDQVSSVSVTLGDNPSSQGKPWLGISYQLLPGFGRVVTRAPGVLIVQVAPNSPASKAGIAQGDTITAIDGVSVSAPRDVTGTIGSHKPGDTLTLTVWSASAGKSSDVTVTLAENPSAAGQPWLGVSLRASSGLRGQLFSNVPGFPGSEESPGAQQPAPETQPAPSAAGV